MVKPFFLAAFLFVGLLWATVVSAQQEQPSTDKTDLSETESDPDGQTQGSTPGGDSSEEAESQEAGGSSTEQDELIAADPKMIENARKHFHQGVAFAQSGNCDAAIAEFEAAYRLIPRPNALYNIGQCQERLFRYDLAIQYYQRYLEEASKDAPDRPAVQGALKTLKNLLGILHVQSNVGSEVWVDDRMMGYAPGDVFVPAGRHIVELRSDGYLPERTEIQIVGREEMDISFTLKKARTTVRVTETTGLSPTLFWIGASATLATAIVGGVIGAHVLSLRDQAENIDALHPDREEAQKDVQQAELTADIFFAAASVLAIGTTIVAFITDWEQEKETPQPKPKDSQKESRLHIRPEFSQARIGLSFQGEL